MQLESDLHPPTFRQRLASAFGHRYPFYSGCGTLANSRLIETLAGGGAGLTWGTLRNGLRLCVPLEDYIGRAVFYFGDLDRKISWICSRIVRPGDAAVDVGANLGIVTLTLAKLAGPRGRVWSFEANPRLVELIRRSAARNGLCNVIAQHSAVGEERAELTLSIPRGHAGRGSLVRAVAHLTCERMTVPVRPLSQLIPEDVQHIRLLKIDVEGYEPQVLRGAVALFDRTPPDAVLFELNDCTGSAADHPSIMMLRSYEYEFLSIRQTYLRMQLRRFDPHREAMVGHDLLACRSGAVFQEIAAAVGAKAG